MGQLRAVLGAALLFLTVFSPAGAVAQDITLTSRDGTVEISGRFLSFDGEFYRLDTVYGQLTVDGSAVRCEGPGCPDLENYVAELALSGSQAMGTVLMPALLEAFAASNGYEARRETLEDNRFTYTVTADQRSRTVARVTFHVSTTDEGFADLLAEEADLAMAARPVRDQEWQLARDAALGNLRSQGRAQVVALDGIVPIAAPGQSVTAISVADLARVFAGQVTNWAELGGADSPVIVHARASGSGLQQGFEDKVLAPLDLGLTEAAVLHPSSEALAEAVARDPFAIGVTGRGSVGNAAALILADGCAFEMSATAVALKTEDYPLTVPLLLYKPERRLPKFAREFLSYLRSPAAQIVVRRAGFVDQAPQEIPLQAQGRRLANAIASAGSEISLAELQRMVAVLGGLRRLSYTFRFEPGSADLDAQSASNVDQLAQALETGALDDRTLVFVGFSDGQGPAEANRTIAEERAAAVRDAVLTAAATADATRLDLRTEAFGEAMPMACDDTDWGRGINRRVEIWVR